MKYTTFLASVAIMASLTAPAMAQDATADTVVATVNGTPITLGQMIIARSQLPPQYQALPAPTLFAGVMDQLIQQQLLAETVTTDPKRVRIALENERRALLTGEVINTLVSEAVTDETIQAAYDAAFVGAAPQTEYNASHILVDTLEEAEAIKARIDGGEDFATVAQETSGDSSAANGGALGWFGAGMMVAPFEEAVMALAVGEVSGPVETQFGWHIVKLNETRIQDAPALEDVRSELVSQVQQDAIEGRLTALMEAAEITRPEEGAFDPEILSNLDLLQD